VVLSLVAPTTAAARTVHLACHDGDPKVLLEGRPIPSDEATCDAVHPSDDDTLRLVRPDGYIAFSSRPADVTALADYLDRTFG
jgi:hypothetical protein